MPGWTLADYLSRTTAGMVNRGDVALSTASFWINEAQRNVWERLPHTLHERIAVSSTTSGENRITLPSDFDELLAFSNTSASPPDPLRPLNLNQAESYTTQSGVPQFYMQYADWMELYPTPNSAYSVQLRYVAHPSDMTATTSAPSLATRYHRALFLRAKQLIAEELRDFETAAQAENQFLREMASLPNDFAKRHRRNHLMGMSLPRRYSQYPSGEDNDDFDTSDA